ncbi:hypothetical protein GCM10022419_014190 [Nonomuraea rosea]|uniref:Integrase catalytic domain-containing protein n=2 Tax=Nonomuraea rosea TaxID=638574 RepID=A0ABP6VM34_9ACTN
MDIIAAYREVGTYRGAAEMCGTTHKTVRRIIERALAGDKAPPRKRREHNYDAVTDLVTEKIKAIAGRMSAKRLLPLAQAAGYAGSARNFRRLVAAAKRSWRREHHRGRRPAVWTPGQMLVIDWDEAGGGLHVFCAVLADRMGCLKSGVVANKVIPTGEYVRFATHYGFRPDWCEAADPESNAIGERVIGTLRRELLDRILILNERHLTLVLHEYLIHYNAHRPHQSRNQRPPDIATQPACDVTDLDDLRSIHRKPVVTCLINEYHNAA